MKIVTLFLYLALAVSFSYGRQLDGDTARRVSDLEAELSTSIPTSEEAAKAMLALIAIYKEHGHAFGLIRTTSLFAESQLGHAEHEDVLLLGIAALKATSDHTKIQAACRQFLQAHPDSKSSAHVWSSLAGSLYAGVPRQLEAAADAFAAAWDLNQTVAGASDAVAAIRGFREHNQPGSHAKAAAIALDVVESLSPDRFVSSVCAVGFDSAKRANDLELAKRLGLSLLELPNGGSAQNLAEVHRSLGDVFVRLDRPDNAISHYERSLKIWSSPETAISLVRTLGAAKKNPSAVDTAYQGLLSRYPEHPSIQEAVMIVARAYVGASMGTKAMAFVEAELASRELSRSAQSEYLTWVDSAGSSSSRAERALRTSIANLPDSQAWRQRWTLAFGIYRDRHQDSAKTAAELRKLLFEHPVNDTKLSEALGWLLDNGGKAEDDLRSYLDTARSLPHFTHYQGLLTTWIKSAERDKERQALAKRAQSLHRTMLDEPAQKLWRSSVDRSEQRARDARQSLLGRGDLTPGQRRSLLSAQAYHYRHRVGEKERGHSVALYGQLIELDPRSYPAARSWVDAAASYGSIEAKRKAVKHLLSFRVADRSDGFAFSRALSIAVSLEDREMASKLHSWFSATEKEHGPAKEYLSDSGASLLALELSDQAASIWRNHIHPHPDSSDAQQCARKFLESIGDDNPQRRIAFLIELLRAQPSSNHGAYSLWLADVHLRAGDIPRFIESLEASATLKRSHPFRPLGFDDRIIQQWIRAASDPAEDFAENERRQILEAVRALGLGRSSGAAALALLEPSMSPPRDELANLVVCYEATLAAGRHYTSWDWLRPYAQRRMTDGRFGQAAAIYTGLLRNVGSVNSEAVSDTRSKIRSAYASLGALSLEVAPDSPVAPLMEIGLHLRLEDFDSARAAYQRGKQIFDAHMHELPAEIVAFAAKTHIDEATPAAQVRAEEILRTWIIKFGEDEKTPAAEKAAIQLLLARSYQASERYDVARAEFKTVLNQFPDSPDSIEAAFGIGETFLAQKVYEEADAIFSELAENPVQRVRIRADFLRGVLALRRDDRLAAREIFRKVLRSMPDVELADQTLFELAEVYRLEKRFLDQLRLLRTVGRLGRSSKRWHVPGHALSIAVQDQDLGVSRGSGRIPVLIETSPGGDLEETFLTSGGAGKGLFMGEIDTALGMAEPDDGIVQVLGADSVTVRYPDEFAAQFMEGQIGNPEIRMAADAAFAMASSWIEEPEDSKMPDSARTTQELRIADLLQADRRPPDQIKPGNLVYLRVSDPDRSLTGDADSIPVLVTASSGDEVQVKLLETGAATGIFRGEVATADLPAGAIASDSAIGHSPLMAIDRAQETVWKSTPDGAVPKWLEVDMKDLYSVDSVTLSSPEPKMQRPVRHRLLGSHDGRFYYELACFPSKEPVEKPAGGYGQMSRRVFKLSSANIESWKQVLDLAAKKEVQSQVSNELTWPPRDTEPLEGATGILWQGLFDQPRDGAVRFELSGYRVALMVDGKLLLPPTEDEGMADVYLTAGAHELSVFISVSEGEASSAVVLRARENLNSPAVRLAQFEPEDFPSPDSATTARNEQAASVVEEDGDWLFSLGARELRHLRFEFDEYTGDSIAVDSILVSGADGVPIPPDADILELADNSVLEIAPGDEITGTYIDQFTQDGIGRNRPLLQRMSATYYNGSVKAVGADFQRAANGGVIEFPKEVLRVDPGERITIEVTDYDLDRTGGRDSIEVVASVLGSEDRRRQLLATETGESTGVFRAELDTTATSGTPLPSGLAIAPGDVVTLSYEDGENTFPGHRAQRETNVYVRLPTDAWIGIVESQVIYTSEPQAEAAPAENYQLREPSSPQQPKNVAYELPLTVTVIDPDAARDTRSTVGVDLLVADRPPVRVLCELSAAFSGDDSKFADNSNPALHEGRFVGQISLQLGSDSSPAAIPVTEISGSSNLLGTVLPPDSTPSTPLSDSPLTQVLNVTGDDVVKAAYRDDSPATGTPVSHFDFAQIASDARLAITDPGGSEPAELLRVGERIYVRLEDPDLDRSELRDKATVEVTTDTGEKETLFLEETLAHSGVFSSSFPLSSNATPVPGNADPKTPAIEAFFGSELMLTYKDRRPPALKPSSLTEARAPVAIGSDGLVAAFSKLFGDEDLAIQTQFHIAESYFQLFKSHRDLERDEQARADLAAGRRTLQELSKDFPDPKYAPRVSYLLGQFAQELGDWDDAINQYESVLRDYPDHSLAPDSQYKLGQCYEESARFDEALDAYVGLAATFPESPLIASVMIRIVDRFYKEEEFLAAAGVGEKFLLRFASHQWTPRIGFRVGQCYYKAEDFHKGGEAFDSFIKKFPDDELAPQALFWAGESYRMGNDVPNAFRRYNRCRWDYPESDAAKYSRGRLALPEMLAQFEREAQLDDAN